MPAVTHMHIILFSLLPCLAWATTVAIIGGGIGGSSAAYFVRQQLDENTNIIVFEKDPVPGGRLQHFIVDGETDAVELGGSIWHESNKFVHGFATRFNVSIRSMANNSGSDHGTLGIWNGNEFVFRTSEWKIVSIAKLFWRYGLSPLKLKSATNDILNRWMSIYEVLDSRSESFETVPEMLHRINLTDLTRVTLSEHLIARGCSHSFVDELITGITRVQYGQDSAAMHALVGLVSLVGAEEEKLFSANEGNRKICEQLLKESGADVRFRTAVKRIEHVDSARYAVIDANDKRTEVDAVIVATPLEFASMEVFAEKGEISPPTRLYQTTVATLVRANKLNGSYFGLSESETIPSEVFTTENSSLPFSSVAVKQNLRDGSAVFKVFSRKDLPQGFLDLLFVNRTWTHSRSWKAYPVMHTPPTHAPFRLAEKLCYVNAFETAISAMETEAIAAKNCVNLIAKSLAKEEKKSRCDSQECKI